MRGGAIVFVIWGFIMSLLLGTDWFWTHNGLDTGLHLFTVTVTIVWASGLFLLRRDSLRPGPPAARPRPESVSTASLGSVMLAWGVCSVVFGFEFGHFLIYFGIGLSIVSAGVLAREHYNERRLLRRYLRGGRE